MGFEVGRNEKAFKNESLYSCVPRAGLEPAHSQ